MGAAGVHVHNFVGGQCLSCRLLLTSVPATIQLVDVTDAQRLAVLHEIYAEMRGSGGSTQVALERYEEKVKGRLR